MNNKLIKNTSILLLTSLLIKLLSLINRIILTRFLGEQGISLYSLILPTIMLFMSLSCFSLNTSMIKVSAKYNSKKIIKNGIAIAIITTSIASLILLFILNFLTTNLLKQPITYYPILFSIPLLYLTSISSVLRGYLTGIEKISTTSFANLIEQITRIVFFIIILLLVNSDKYIIYVIYAILAMSVGELFSISFTTWKIIKLNISNNNINNNLINKELLEISLPTTLISLISNLTFFLEPIFFTFILNKFSYNSNDILLKYSEVTAFSLPLITLFSFISMSISTAIMPKIAVASIEKIKKYISNLIIICLIPGILISTILFNYNNEITYLLYGTYTGSAITKKYVWYFIIFYLISPLNTILISTNQAKKTLYISIIIHIIKLLCILILPFISNDSLMLSYLISYFLTFILQFIFLLKKYKFKIPYKELFSLLLLVLIINCISIIMKYLNITYILQIIIISIFYLILVIRFIKRNYF